MLALRAYPHPRSLSRREREEKKKAGDRSPAFVVSRKRRAYCLTISSSSTSNFSVEFGPIGPGVPRSP